MKYIFTLLALFLPINVHAIGTSTLKASKRTLSCLPANASVAGLQTSLDFGKAYGICVGYTCNSDWTASGNSCVANAPPFNVVCSAGAGFSPGRCSVASNLNVSFINISCSYPAFLRSTFNIYVI